MDSGKTTAFGSIPVAELPTVLIEMGAKLKDPPEDLNEKLTLLDSVEDLFSVLGQKPSFPVLHSLSLAKEGLIAEKLFGNSNVEVKVSSLACLHELIRITAPEAPFEDDIMQEIYEETIKSFEHLSSSTGRCFEKATRILGYAAKEQSLFYLLELCSETLLVQMFQLFLCDIRSDYPNDVVSNMGNLMTTLIRGADRLSLDLLRPLLMSIRKENQDISPPSSSLARKVLEECSVEVKPYLISMVEELKEDLDVAANAVSSLWPQTPAEDKVLPLDNDRAEQIEPGEKVRKRKRGLPLDYDWDEQIEPGEGVCKRKRGLPKKFAEDYLLYEMNSGGNSSKVSKRRKKKELVKSQEDISHGSENLNRLEKSTKGKECQEELLGSRIKVWWTEDQEYYEGMIRSYDPARKKHEVVYLDGFKERVRLAKKDWFVVDDTTSASQQVQEANPAVPAGEVENGRGCSEEDNKATQETAKPSPAEKDFEEKLPSAP